MDHDAFDRLTRLLGTPGSRRAALGALLGSSVLGAAESAFAKKRGKGKDKQRGKAHKQRDKKRGAAAKPQTPDDGAVAIEATCGSPGPSSNLNGCNFSGDDMDGVDLSSSSMKNTNFNGARLCGADLSSSTLTNADFRNANLTRADLHSSGCNGIKTNAATRFCQTIMCNGSVNNSDCPTGAAVCCATGDCEDRACHVRACEDSACEHTRQADGEPGNLCPDPRECCNGNCCPEGQKCCGDTCIPNDQCCGPNDTPGCPTGQQCCGGNVCSHCCNGNQAGCAAGSVCCGTACVSGVCCGSFQFCETEEQCCGDQDEMSCLSPTPGAPKRCCGNEDEHCQIGENGGFHCCPGLVCCTDPVFGGTPTCEETCAPF
jgi:hypothetical protein